MHTTLLTKPARYMLLTWVTVLLGVAMSAALMLIGSPLPARAQGTIYVDADAPGPAHDGLSWSTAYTTVQEALVAAASGDEIWVAQGVYYPDEGVGQTDNVLTSTFTLTTGVALYGGFAPGVDADEWSERDWETYLTVLSGDLEQNDALTRTAWSPTRTISSATTSITWSPAVLPMIAPCWMVSSLA